MFVRPALGIHVPVKYLKTNSALVDTFNTLRAKQFTQDKLDEGRSYTEVFDADTVEAKRIRNKAPYA